MPRAQIWGTFSKSLIPAMVVYKANDWCFPGAEALLPNLFFFSCLSHFTIKVYASVNSPRHVGFWRGFIFNRPPPSSNEVAVFCRILPCRYWQVLYSASILCEHLGRVKTCTCIPSRSNWIGARFRQKLYIQWKDGEPLTAHHFALQGYHERALLMWHCSVEPLFRISILIKICFLSSSRMLPN